MQMQHLNKCLESELAAVHMYIPAIERRRAAHDPEPDALLLREMLMDHQEAAARLRSFIRTKGGQPSSHAAVERFLSNALADAKAPSDDEASLRTLKTLEESVLRDYHALVRAADAGADVKDVVTPIVRRQRKHIVQLDQLIERSA